MQRAWMWTWRIFLANTQLKVELGEKIFFYTLFGGRREQWTSTWSAQAWISHLSWQALFLSWLRFPSSWSVERTSWRSSRGGSNRCERLFALIPLSLRSCQLINLLVQRGYEMLDFTWEGRFLLTWMRNIGLGWDSTTEVSVSPKTSLLIFCGERFNPNEVMCGCNSSQYRI